MKITLPKDTVLKLSDDFSVTLTKDTEIETPFEGYAENAENLALVGLLHAVDLSHEENGHLINYSANGKAFVVAKPTPAEPPKGKGKPKKEESVGE